MGVFLCLKKINSNVAVLQFVRKILLAICGKIKKIEILIKNRKIKDNLFFVSCCSNGVYLNNVKIIDKKANLQLSIFKILMEKHLLGRLYTTSTGLNVFQISEILRSRGRSSFEEEKQIRQAIYQIKKNIAKKFDHHISEIFIESSRLSGVYKLGKNIAFICY